MQIADSFSKSPFPPSPGGNTPDIADQKHQQRKRHQRILLLRTLQFWWYPILFIVLGDVAAIVLGIVALNLWKIALGGVAFGVFVFIASKRLELGLLLVTIFTVPFIPTVLKVSYADISSTIPALVCLCFILLVQVAFHVKKPVLPSFWTIWPLLGLILMAFVSEIMIQATWLPIVPHKVLSNPSIIEEITGLLMYCMPLLTVFTVTTCLTKKEKWIEYIQYAYMIFALLDALVMIYEFRRVGADIYTFRYSVPSIGWMPLEALAQLLVLGSLLFYARFLYATRWKTRIIFGVPTLICLLALYFTLENSWWSEGAIALAVMTIVYSRKLFASFCVAGLPFLPLVVALIHKLQTVKAVDSLRFVIWQDMLRVWMKRPLLGVGPGNLWAYDQVFTKLPQGVRNFALSGFGVAHNGYLQTLGELGPIGLLFQLAFIIVLIIASARLVRRSRSNTLEVRNDRILGLVALGLVCGSAAGDITSSFFFLPPRQMLHVLALPQVLTSWIIYGCVIYKDQLWRMTRRGLRIED